MVVIANSRQGTNLDEIILVRGIYGLSWYIHHPQLLYGPKKEGSLEENKILGPENWF